MYYIQNLEFTIWYCSEKFLDIFFISCIFLLLADVRFSAWIISDSWFGWFNRNKVIMNYKKDDARSLYVLYHVLNIHVIFKSDTLRMIRLTIFNFHTSFFLQISIHLHQRFTIKSSLFELLLWLSMQGRPCYQCHQACIMQNNTCSLLNI